MDFQDLGEITGPLLVFGGPYSNLTVTRALRQVAGDLNIPAARTICTGDVVAYAGEPSETTDAVIDWGVHVVMGNCEESFGWQSEDCGCGFEEGTDCDVASRQWYAYANSCLRPAQRTWMRGLARQIRFTLAGRRFAVLHGGVQSINEFVFEMTDDAVKRGGLDTLGVDAIIAGHSGVPFTQEIDGRLWHNAGVIGMPANDGTPRVWYSLIDEADGAVRIRHVALDYDHAAAAYAMRRKRLPEGYARCLETGLWPNMDVMPEAEKAKSGRALEETTVLWSHTPRAAAE